MKQAEGRETLTGRAAVALPGTDRCGDKCGPLAERWSFDRDAVEIFETGVAKNCVAG